MRIKIISITLLLSIVFISSSVFAQGAPTNNIPDSASGVGFLSNSDLSIIPPCLRTATAAQSAGIECVEQSIFFYSSMLLVLIAIGAFFYFLYGAFLYTTAFGDEGKVKTAKDIIKYAVIGMFIAIFSRFMINVLIDSLNVTGLQ